MKETNLPFRYEPSGDSDGFTAGIDHFVLDANGEELACAPNEEIGLLFAASPDLYRELRHLVQLLEPLERDGSLNIPGLATLNGARMALAKVEPSNAPDPI